MSNYGTKTDLKKQQKLIKRLPSFAKKVDLASLKSNLGKLDFDKLNIFPTNLSNLKSKVDKLGVDKLISIPVDLTILSTVVKNDVVKKDLYNGKIKKY